MEKEIKHTWFFTQAPQEVWDFLTKPELLEQWLMKTDFQPVVGHKFRFNCTSETHGEVLESKPFTRLSYTWKSNSPTSRKLINSTVTWTLTPIDNGTELLLVHDGFTLLEDLIGHNGGWTACGDRFVQLLKPVTV